MKASEAGNSNHVQASGHTCPQDTSWGIGDVVLCTVEFAASQSIRRRQTKLNVFDVSMKSD